MHQPHQNPLSGSGSAPPIPSSSSPSSPSPPSSPRSPTTPEEQLLDSTENWDDRHSEFSEPHQIQHLVPCTWSEFLDMDTPPYGYYEYIDGLVVHCMHTDDANHNFLRDALVRILTFQNFGLYIYARPCLQVLEENSTPTSTTEKESNGDGASSHDQQTTPQYSLRHPDMVILETKRGSTGSVAPGEGDPRIQISYPYRKKVLAAVEITGESTRSVDLYRKWSAYSRSRLPMYVILDRGTATEPERVIVGSLEAFKENSEKKAHGDPNPSMSPSPFTQETALYYREIYESDEKVDCPYFSNLDMTASQLLDAARMHELAIEQIRGSGQRDWTEEKNEADWEENSADWTEERVEWEKKRADWTEERVEWEKERVEWEKERVEWEKKRADWEKKRADWTEERVEWEKERVEWEKKRAEEAERKIGELRARIDALERSEGKHAGASSASSSPTKSAKHKKNLQQSQ